MIHFLFILSFVLTFSSTSYAGISTNGGSLTKDQNNVWYLGDQTVRYCVEHDSTSPIVQDEVRQLIRHAINDWKDFFKKYQLDQLAFDNLKNHSQLKLSLKFEEQKSCDEDPELLRFIFSDEVPYLKSGITIDEIKNSLALAIRSDYNHKTYRNGGVVWIRDVPLTKRQLKHLLLHELGHIFGMEHDSVYVMDTHVADQIVKTNYSALHGFIESPTWVYRLRPGDIIDFSSNGHMDTSYESNFLLSLFKIVFNFDNPNHHSAQLFVENAYGGSSTWKMNMQFVEAETSRTVQMQGDFLHAEINHNDTKGRRGPVLYTNWYCQSCEPDGTQYRRYLDPYPSILEATGSFKYNNIVYPAILENRKGILLRIFITDHQTWWTSQNYFSSSVVFK